MKRAPPQETFSTTAGTVSRPVVVVTRQVVPGGASKRGQLRPSKAGSACGSVLKRAGAKSVTLLTLARVDRRAPQPAVERYQTMGAS